MQLVALVSERRACVLVGVNRATYRYQSQRLDQDQALIERIQSLAYERKRFGYRRIHQLLIREGVQVNHKKVYRLYSAEGLAVRKRAKRSRASVDRQPLQLPTEANHTWSMDFVMDALVNGRRLKCLTIVDDYTKECLDIPVNTRLTGHDVVRTLEAVAAFRGLPKSIRTDQGPEFTSKALTYWADQKGVELLLIEAGQPTQNAYIESFNGKFRDECLNEHWFGDVAQAQHLIQQWRVDYNEARPHSALGYYTPSEFAVLTRTKPLELTSTTKLPLD